MNSTQLRKKIETFEKEIEGMVRDRELLLNKVAADEDEGTKFDAKKLATMGSELQDRTDILQKLRERLAVVIAEEEKNSREALISDIVETGKQSVDIMLKAIENALAGVKTLPVLIETFAQEIARYGTAKDKLPVTPGLAFDELIDLIGGRNHQRLLNFNPFLIIEFLDSLKSNLKRIDFYSYPEILRSANEDFRLRLEDEKAVVEKREKDIAAFVAERERRARYGVSEPQAETTIGDFHQLETDQA